MRAASFILLLLCAAAAHAQTPYETGRGWQLEVSPYEQGPGTTLMRHASDNYMSMTGLYRVAKGSDVQLEVGYTDRDSYVYGKLGLGWMYEMPQQNWVARFDFSVATGARSDGFTGRRHVAEGRLALVYALKASRDIHAFPGVFIAVDTELERSRSVRRYYCWFETPASPPNSICQESSTHWDRKSSKWYGVSRPAYLRVWKTLRVVVEPSIGVGHRSNHEREFSLRAGGQYTF
ncbi:MAG: hypothetical protein RhofKO_14320 [Rhodothermales bacterium]